MIELTSTVSQTLQPGQSASFNKVLLRTGCSECYNQQLPTSVRLNGGCCSIYEIRFGGNITSDAAATPIQLAISVGGSTLVETAMNAVPAAANDLVNVSTGTLFRLDCSDLDRVSVTNVGTNPLTLAQNPAFYINRRA